MKRRILIPALASAALASAAIVPLPVAAATPASTLSWSDCGDGLRCASLDVPANWRKPGGTKTKLELGMLPAKNPATRRGTIIVNTGGPAPTLPVLRSAPQTLEPLRQWYDVVGMDPRGIGEKGHVRCPVKSSDYFAAVADTSQTAWQKYAGINARYDASCHQTADPLVSHMNSWQVAHDIDAVRAAVGEKKLTYFGNSYGTLYGQAYAELFPRRVHRMVLDSVVDHTRKDLYAQVLEPARALEARFDEFSSWCASTPKCALHGRNVPAVWDALMAKATRTPIPAPSAGSDVRVTADQIRLQTGNMVDARPGSVIWVNLADAILAAEKGDAGKLIYKLESGSLINRYAVCSDSPLDTSYRNITRVEKRLKAQAKRVGWLQLRMNYGRCAGLTTGETYAPHPLRTPGLSPVLLINGTSDAATPIADAQHVADQLPGAGLVTAKDAYHAVYMRENTCARTHAHHYLETGKVPPAGTTCLPNTTG